MVDTRRQLLDPTQLAACVAAIRRILVDEPSVIGAWVHGSVARGEPARDLDLALLAAEGADAWSIADRVARRVDAEIHPGIEIDVRPLDGSAAPAFRFAVVRDGVLVADGDPERRAAFAAAAVRDWLDFAPTFERLSRAFVRKVSRAA